MSAHANDNAEDLRRLMWACADTSVSPRAILEAYEAREPFTSLGKVIEMARRSTRRDGAGFSRRPEREPLKPRRTEGEALLAARTKDIVKRLQPWIERRRGSLFGQTAPPLQSLAEAATWIEQEAGTEHRAMESSELQALKREIGRSLDRLLDVDPWVSYQLAGRNYWLRYWTGNGEPGMVRVSHKRQPLWGVYATAKRIEDISMLPAPTVVAWILTDIRPGQRVRLREGRVAMMPGLSLVSWRIHYPHGSGVPDGPPLAVVPRVILDVDSRDLTDRNLRVARREAMGYLERRSPKLTPKQTRILDIVQRLGPPKEKFSRVFWHRVAKNWPTEIDPIALARLYYRAQTAAGDPHPSPSARGTK
jgi:hypothetical protein